MNLKLVLCQNVGDGEGGHFYVPFFHGYLVGKKYSLVENLMTVAQVTGTVFSDMSLAD